MPARRRDPAEIEPSGAVGYDGAETDGNRPEDDMRKMIAFTLGILFAAGIAGTALAECPGHTRTSDAGTKTQTVADASGSHTKTAAPGK